MVDTYFCLTLNNLDVMKILNNLEAKLSFPLRILQGISITLLLFLLIILFVSPTQWNSHTKITVSLCVALIIKDIFEISTHIKNFSASGCVTRGLYKKYCKYVLYIRLNLWKWRSISRKLWNEKPLEARAK